MVYELYVEIKMILQKTRLVNSSKQDDSSLVFVGAAHKQN